jgi:HAD superfamily hydrolase (TIGR01509 family)
MIDIELCVFDVDGVLVNSKNLHYPSTAMAIAEYGYTYSRVEDENFGTIPTRKKLESLAEENKISYENIEDIWKLKEKYSWELFDQNVICNTKIKDLFHKLKNSNIKIALASNARYSFIDKVIELLDIHDYIDLVLSAQEIIPKPDPEIYLMAMKILGVSPDKTLIFEDSEVGKAAAYASGANVYEVSSYDELSSSIFNENETYSTSR